MIKVGNTVKFRVYDTLFKTWINATGVVIGRLYGKLWTISAKDQPGLHRDFETWVHEDNINA